MEKIDLVKELERFYKGERNRVEPDGKITCPSCKSRYKPALQPVNGNRSIQEVYPNATPEEREELISGLCSRCQTAVFGDSEE